MPPGLKLALGPVLEQIAEMTIKIKQYDREIQRMTQAEYAWTQPLLTIQGVGHITALTFVLTLGNKQRFERSRDVGCYLFDRMKTDSALRQWGLHLVATRWQAGLEQGRR